MSSNKPKLLVVDDEQNIRRSLVQSNGSFQRRGKAEAVLRQAMEGLALR